MSDLIEQIKEQVRIEWQSDVLIAPYGDGTAKRDRSCWIITPDAIRVAISDEYEGDIKSSGSESLYRNGQWFVFAYKRIDDGKNPLEAWFEVEESI